jgi:tripartite-type tricarboxylate transporter receptor subunit TctC
MRMPCFSAGMLSVGAIVLGTNVAYGQAYPNKPIRIVLSEAGGNSDLAARLIAQGAIPKFLDGKISVADLQPFNQQQFRRLL